MHYRKFFCYFSGNWFWTDPRGTYRRGVTGFVLEQLRAGGAEMKHYAAIHETIVSTLYNLRWKANSGDLLPDVDEDDDKLRSLIQQELDQRVTVWLDGVE
eukprot:TRINITY_DN96922_c0_g1_i1.p2 TRINITY_DN96922_c0_g1~~TRINITY_DN96922_c0_g1_i1.p2  ORF type:complete len:100 (+),score=16.06 TRINITY_DN96922_c0_g1_i1:67-366(+)